MKVPRAYKHEMKVLWFNRQGKSHEHVGREVLWINRHGKSHGHVSTEALWVTGTEVLRRRGQLALEGA